VLAAKSALLDLPFFCGENLVAVASIVQKWARFDLSGRGLKFFAPASRAVIPWAPPTFNIFLCLW